MRPQEQQTWGPLVAKKMRIPSCSILGEHIPLVASFRMFKAGLSASVGLICGNTGRDNALASKEAGKRKRTDPEMQKCRQMLKQNTSNHVGIQNLYPSILKNLAIESHSDLSPILENWKNPVFLSKHKMFGIY